MKTTWFTTLFLITTLPLGSMADEPSLQDLDGLTGRWIDLRTTLAEEARLWQNRKAVWQQEIALLQKQSEVLGKELKDTRDVLSSAEENRSDSLARREQLETELTQVDHILDQAVRDARKLAPGIPAPLRKQLPPELQYMLDTGSPDLPRAQRAQRLVALLSTLESMQNRFHALQQTLETDTGRRQVEVIYIGLAQGFAVSPNNDWAAVGSPGPDGWSWEPGQVDPQEVRRLIEVYHQRETAALATVPLHLKETP